MHDITEHYVHTLFDLSATMPLEKITVSRMLKETNTARQTFYNHFRDMRDLIAYAAQWPFTRDGYAVFRNPQGTQAAYEFALEHRSFFMQLPRQNGQNCFRDAHIDWLRRAYLPTVIRKDNSAEENELAKIQLEIFLAGSVDTFLRWCSCGMDWEPSIMAQAIFLSVPSCIDLDHLPAFEKVPR